MTMRWTGPLSWNAGLSIRAIRTHPWEQARGGKDTVSGRCADVIERVGVTGEQGSLTERAGRIPHGGIVNPGRTSSAIASAVGGWLSKLSMNAAGRRGVTHR